MRLAAEEAPRDLRELLAEQPPANPFLRERWIEEGLLDEGQGG